MYDSPWGSALSPMVSAFGHFVWIWWDGKLHKPKEKARWWFWIFFYFTLLTNIFQMGWNHHAEEKVTSDGTMGASCVSFWNACLHMVVFMYSQIIYRRVSFSFVSITRVFNDLKNGQPFLKAKKALKFVWLILDILVRCIWKMGWKHEQFIAFFSVGKTSQWTIVAWNQEQVEIG